MEFCSRVRAFYRQASTKFPQQERFQVSNQSDRNLPVGFADPQSMTDSVPTDDSAFSIN
jgi:hypothetical protein